MKSNGRTSGVPEQHSSNIFRDVVVCCTGLRANDRSMVRELVESLGGKFLCDLQPNEVTHVVATSTTTHKYQVAARCANMVVVNKLWVQDCYKRKKMVDARQPQYQMLPLVDCVVCTSGFSQNDKKKIGKTITRLGGRYETVMTAMGGVTHLITEIPSGKRFQCAQDWNISTVKMDWLYSCVEHNYRVPETSFYFSDEEIAHHSKYMQAVDGDIRAQEAQKTTRQLEEMQEVLDLHQRECGNYLNRHRFFVYGFKKEQTKKIIRLLWCGGGTRYAEFHPRVTHVVASPTVAQDAIDEIKTSGFTDVRVVDVRWLIECCKQREYITDRCYDWTQMREEEVASPVASDEATCSSNVDRSISPFGATPHRSQSARPGTPASKHRSSPVVAGKTNIFQGHSFCCLLPNNAMEMVSVKTIIQHGGRVITTRTPPSRAFRVDFAVVLHDADKLPPENVTRMQVTPWWVAQSATAGHMLEVAARPMYLPLRISVPLEAWQYDQPVMLVANYVKDERNYVEMLAKVLGAKLSRKFNTEVTHLICRGTRGDKYAKARQRGIPVVSLEWLNEICCTGEVPALPAQGAESNLNHSHDAKRPRFIGTPSLKLEFRRRPAVTTSTDRTLVSSPANSTGGFSTARALSALNVASLRSPATVTSATGSPVPATPTTPDARLAAQTPRSFSGMEPLIDTDSAKPSSPSPRSRMQRKTRRSTRRRNTYHDLADSADTSRSDHDGVGIESISQKVGIDA